MDSFISAIKVKSEERSNILEISQCLNAPVIFLSLDFHVLDYNEAAQKIYHWSRTAILNKSYVKWCESRKILPAITLKDKDNILNRKLMPPLESPAPDGDRMIIWNIFYNLNEHDDLNGIIVIGKEVAQNKSYTYKIEKLSEEKNEEATIESIVACIPGSVYWKNRQGIYLGCNDAIADCIGISKEEIIGKTDYDIAKKLGWNKKIADAFKKIDIEVMQNGIPRLNVEEMPFPDKNGHIIQQLTNKAPLRNAQGDIIGVVGNSIDISDRKKVELALREEKEAIYSELSNVSKNIMGYDIGSKKSVNEYFASVYAYLENIISTMPCYVYWKNKDFVYLGCNDLIAKILKLPSRKAIIGKTDYDFGWKKEDVDAYRKIDERVVKTGKPSLNVEEIVTIEGRDPIHLLVNKMPIFDEHNQIVGIVGISIDITDRKKMEEELRKAKEKAEIASKAKTTFIANMSHDIRTPLTGIIGMSMILEQEAHNPEEKEHAHNVLICGERLSDLLNSVLEIVSSEEIDEQHLNKKTFDLRKLIQDLHDIYLLNAQEKKLALKIKLDDLVPSFVISDQLKLYRVLFNIIGNAIKFTEKGQVVIEVKHLGSAGQHVLLEFSVSDTGIGISDDFKDKVFDRFSREIPSYKGTYKGHGIGLNLAQNYVTALGGKINVTSKQGQGSTFSFELAMELGKAEDFQSVETIPMKSTVNENKSALTKVKTDSLSHTSTSSLTILVVEDDFVAMQATKAILKQVGSSVMTATSGEEALDMAKKSHYDLILTDLGLPKMSGEEFVQYFREWEKSSGRKPIPIVALTGHGNNREVVKTCLEAGINEVLTKPTTLAAIQTLFNKLIVSVQPSSRKSGFDLPETEEELFQLERYPLFEIKTGLKYAGSENTLKEISQLFIEYSILAASAQLQKAHEEKNWEIVSKIAHRIMGGALYLGIHKMAYAGRYLSKYYLNGHRDQNQLEKLYQQLIRVMDETKKAIENYLATEEKNKH